MALHGKPDVCAMSRSSKSQETSSGIGETSDHGGTIIIRGDHTATVTVRLNSVTPTDPKPGLYPLSLAAISYIC